MSDIKKFFGYPTPLPLYFIYDQESASTFFTSYSLPKDTLITEVLGLKLVLRRTNELSEDSFVYPITNFTKDDIPLLKSNLQKAVRRRVTEVAQNTLVTLLGLDSMEVLRRLPIIMIEDVCLLSSMGILIWFMMVGKKYRMMNVDVEILLGIVAQMCDEENAYKCTKDEYQEISAELIKNHLSKDYLLPLYYRKMYGGMKGDMILLGNALEYYYHYPEEIVETDVKKVNLPKIVKLDILNVAIDFHPYPYFTNYIWKATGIDPQIVKEYIWKCESGVNYRKEYTLEQRNQKIDDEVWKKILKVLKYLRNKIMNSGVLSMIILKNFDIIIDNTPTLSSLILK